GEAVQENFYDHEITRTRQVPEIEIYLADVDAPPIGVGEVDTPMVSAAIACAFFAAKEQRLRNMPFTPDRVRNALTV
ncbi:MAG: xanthine dehydrogenase family protein molybdopterin-binding subunit, partial [Rhodobacteraceae bacterium]|nr:xanthine dehydrogenase family protein molybdopterin-binding subunit [Paracoccaceae bacterium]